MAIFFQKYILSSLNMFLKVIDNKSALVQVMVWHQIGAKPLLEPVMTRISVTKWYHTNYNELSLQIVIVE